MAPLSHPASPVSVRGSATIAARLPQQHDPNIKELLAKLEEIHHEGGHTSSMERELHNWLRELNAIEEVLRIRS